MHDETQAEAPSGDIQSVAAAEGRHAMPRQLAYLTTERPLLWYENAADYDALLSGVFDELSPVGVLESIHVKELVDYLWETRRMRRLKLAAIHDSMPSEAADGIVGTISSYSPSTKSEEHAEVYAIAGRAAVAPPGEEQVKELNAKAKRSCLSPEMLHYRTHIKEADDLDRVNGEVRRLEDRCERLMRQIEARRSSLAAMARKLVARDAEMASSGAAT
ncbi:hypothetical protein [Aestuariivirga sp.]|uniref:hypothetical protein n=1 Tax=Aestuariivirga sp. TaxID=2650926 RepID=UPI003BA9C35C